MAVPRTTVFVSATSGDLAACRGVVDKMLSMHGIYSIVQERLPPDYHDLVTSLRRQIGSCDAVACLVGQVYGAAPAQTNLPPRSYTQLEYDIARELNKPVFAFLTSDEFIPPKRISENENARKWQQDHRASLLEAHKCWFFASPEELSHFVVDAIPPLQQLAGCKPIKYMHLPKAIGYFAGRQRELRQLEDAILQRVPAVIAVVGMGGQGKTTLARQVIVASATFPFAAGFWCSANLGGFSFDNFLDEILKYLVGPEFDKRQCRERAARLNLLIQELQQRPTLVVIDGIEQWLCGWHAGASGAPGSGDHRRGASDGLDELLVAISGLENGSHLVITTRALPSVLDPPVACSKIPVLDEGRPESLEGLDDADAVSLLRKLGVKGNDQQLTNAANRYANHPLALEVIAGLLSEAEGGLIERLPEVQVLDSKERLFELLDITRKRLSGGRDVEKFLRLIAHFTEDPSLESIEQQMRYFRYRWLMPVRRFGAGTDPKRSKYSKSLQQIAITLGNWHLLTWDGANKVVRPHALVKEFFASQTKNSRSIHRRLASWYSRQPLPRDPQTAEHARTRELAIHHAMRAMDLDQCVLLMFGPFIDRFSYADWIASWGHQTKGIDLLDELIASSSGVTRGKFLLARSSMMITLGRPEAAAAGADENILIFENATWHYRSRRLDLARALATRGILRRLTGFSGSAVDDYCRAIAEMKRVIRIRTWMPGSNTARIKFDLAKTYMNRGLAHKDIGSNSQALLDYDLAIQLSRDLLKRMQSLSAWLLADTHMNRGIVFADLHEFDAAIKDFRESVAELERLVNCGHGDIDHKLANVRGILGFALFESGVITEGLSLLDQCVDQLQRLRDADRSDVKKSLAVSLMNRAHARLRTGNIDSAMDDCSRSFSILEQQISDGVRHLESTIAHLRMLRSEIFYRLGKFAESAEDRRISLQTFQSLIQKWSQESDVRAVFLRNAFAAVKYLADRDQAEAAAVFSQLRPELQRSFAGTDSSELTRAVSRRVATEVHQLGPKLTAAGIDLQGIPKPQSTNQQLAPEMKGPKL